MTYLVTVTQGDSPTFVDLDLTEAEVQLLERIAAAVVEAAGEYGSILTVETTATADERLRDLIETVS